MYNRYIILVPRLSKHNANPPINGPLEHIQHDQQSVMPMQDILNRETTHTTPTHVQESDRLHIDILL